MRLSLRIKLILAFSAVVIAAVAGIILFANLESERQVQTYIARGGQYGLTSLVEDLENYYETNGSWEGAESVITSSNFRGGRNSSRGQNSGIELLDKQGTMIWSSDSNLIGSNLENEVISSGAIQLFNTRDKLIGYLLVDAAVQTQVSDISPFVTRLKDVVVYSGIAAAVMAIALAILLSNYLLKPVKALTRASGQLSAGDLSTRVNVKGNDELTELAETFNHMAANLETAEERKKALTADVAHELRTPIAVQKAQLEGMLDRVIPITNENLQIALQQTDFLSRLVDDLRLLAMAEAGELKLENRETDLKKMVEQLVAQFSSHLQGEGTKIITEFQGYENNSTVMLDPDRLTQIINNLLSNAQRYGKKGGVISVSCHRERGQVMISIKDDGPGIPESAIPHLFERFYRHEKARSRETGGTGLGLAISRKLALLMGGDLTAGNQQDGGAVFILTLPTQ
jgi:signal transduction histidine kinase